MSAADLPQLPVLEAGAWTVGPAWLAIAGFEPAEVQVHGPAAPLPVDEDHWGASPDKNADPVEFTPSVAQAVDWPPAFSPTEFGGAMRCSSRSQAASSSSVSLTACSATRATPSSSGSRQAPRTSSTS